MWPLTLFVVVCAYLLSAWNNSGDPRDRQAGRAVRLSDFFAEPTHLNWIVCAVLALVIVAVVWARRRHV